MASVVQSQMQNINQTKTHFVDDGKLTGHTRIYLNVFKITSSSLATLREFQKKNACRQILEFC